MNILRVMERARNKKGIEAIVGAVLLIVITVVAAVLLYLWFTGYLTGTASKAPQINTVQQFIVTGASISSSGQVTAYVENTGNVPVTIAQANVLNSTNGAVVCAAIPGGSGSGAPTSPTNLSPTSVSSGGSVGTVTFSCSSPTLKPGQSYTIQLISNSGVSAEYTTTAS
ncbi:hypothetical protein GCM10007981_18790 [Thermocladium modestius]|uniref:Archaeal Type IV pilin N-terminal domain-containing protein n=2 Tax=Thermocladium modestius TaxID=62609 RepID=A0A830GYI6_9CREN|nr:hypothetical protein GCM10007981_18790 [Thermocladium modestius]